MRCTRLIPFDPACIVDGATDLRTTRLVGPPIPQPPLIQAGQENYKALTRQYYRDADGCLVVFGACLWLSRVLQVP